MGTMNREQRRAKFKEMQKKVRGYEKEGGVIHLPIKGSTGDVVLDIDTDDFDVAFKFISMCKKYENLDNVLKEKVDKLDDYNDSEVSSAFYVMQIMRELFLDIRNNIDDVLGEGTGDKVWGKGKIPTFSAISDFFETIYPVLSIILAKSGMDFIGDDDNV